MEGGQSDGEGESQRLEQRPEKRQRNTGFEDAPEAKKSRSFWMGEASQEHSPADSGWAFVPPDPSEWACPASAAPVGWCEHGLASLYRTEAPEADTHKKLKHATVARAALIYKNSSKTFYISEESMLSISWSYSKANTQGCTYVSVAHTRLAGIPCSIIIPSHSNCSSAQNCWALTRLLGSLSVGRWLRVSRAYKSHPGLESWRAGNRWSR